MLLGDLHHGLWVNALGGILVANLDCLLELALRDKVDILEWLVLGKYRGASNARDGI